MTKVRWTMCGALVACAGLAVAMAVAGEEAPKKAAPGAPAGGKGTPLESKAEKVQCASTVNFAKDLGLSFPSLTTLGSRIEQARNQADPVSLALDARELGVAEKVSGKTAAIKSEDLLKEAAELAKLRYNPAELKAVAMLAGKVGAGKDLVAVAEKAEKDHADAIKAKASGEKTRGIQGRLHVDSRVPNTGIMVYVDGRYVGTMGPMGDIYPYIGQTPWETTYLSARSYDGRTWNRAVRGAYGDYTWTLYP